MTGSVETAADRANQKLPLGLILDCTPALIHTARADGSLDFFNRSWLNYVGQPAEKLLGWAWTAFIHPDDLDALLLKWRQSIATGNEFEAEARVRRADGQYRWMFHRKVRMATQDGTAVRWFGSSIDIEERKQAEDARRMTEAWMTEVQRVAGVTGWVIEAPDKMVYSSPDYSELAGAYSGETIPGSIPEFLEHVHPDDRTQVKRALETLLQRNEPSGCTYRIVRPDHQIRVVRAAGIPVRQNGVVTHYVGARIDMTEKEETARDLERSHAYLLEAQKLSHTGSVGWRAESKDFIWSEETYRIFEFETGTTVTFERVLERIHPEDREHAREAMEMARRGEERIDFEHRLLFPDHRIKHLHLVAGAVPEPPGARDYIGAVMDVTAQKQAEDAIRRSEAELRQIVDAVPQQVFVFAPDWTPLFANRQLLQYTGISAEESRSKTAVLRLFHPEDVARVIKARERALRDATPVQFEARIRGVDGSYRWFLIRDNPLCDEPGHVLRWYGTRTDIEEQKQAEERLHRENIALRQEVSEASMFEEVVGSSSSLRAVLSRVAKVAPTDSTVLIFGETGTGKELIARAVHRLSPRSARAFVTVNCAAIPKDLISSELFGHEKGSFTGAIQKRLGRFELADGGTIFLDEIGDLPPDLQSALLRVLQEHEIERVGGNRPISVNVRVIAATNRDLKAAIAAGTFRSDLFYRLNVFPIEVPPLRRRREDIPLLVEYFADRFARKAGKSIRGVNRKTMELLQSYNWPGNVRELQNVIERSVIFCDSENLSVEENWLPQQEFLAEPSADGPLPDELSEHARNIIEAALAQSRGRVSGPKGAAAHLGVPRSTLESKIRSLKIDKKQFRGTMYSQPQ